MATSPRPASCGMSAAGLTLIGVLPVPSMELAGQALMDVLVRH